MNPNMGVSESGMDVDSTEQTRIDRSSENAVLAEIGRVMSASPDINEVFDRFADRVGILIPFDRMMILSVDVEKGTITNAYLAGLDVKGAGRGRTSEIADTSFEDVVRTRLGYVKVRGAAEELATRVPIVSAHLAAGLKSFLAVPLISADRVVGVLSMRSASPDAYTQEDLNLAQRVGNQIAGVVANAQLYAERVSAEHALRESERKARRAAQETAIIANIGRVISSTLNLEKVYPHFADAVRELIPFDRLAIVTGALAENTSGPSYTPGMKQNANVRSYAIGLEHLDPPRRNELAPITSESLLQVVNTRSSLLLQTDDRDEVKNRFPALVRLFDGGIRSFLSVPLVSGDEIVGILSLRSRQTNAYCDENVVLAEQIAPHLASAIANAAHFEESVVAQLALQRSEAATQRLAEENAVMAEIGRIISSSLDISDIYDQFADQVRKLVQFDRLTIMTADHETDSMTVRYLSGQKVANQLLGAIIPMKGAMAGSAILNREGWYLAASEALEQLGPGSGVERAVGAGLRSFLAVPLIHRDRAIGALSMSTTSAEAYTEEDLKLSERIGTQIAGAIDRAQLLDERTKAQLALQESEERFRSLFEDSAAGIVLADRYGQLIKVNQAMCRFLGYDEPELTSKSVSEVTFHGDREESNSLLRHLWAGAIDSFAIEKRFLHEDGHLVWGALSVSAVRDAGGNIVCSVAQIQDITERKLLQEQLLQSQKMEAVGQLAGVVAHDFNNLLTAILGYASLAKMQLDPGDPGYDYLEHVQSAGERAATITRQLLTFSRRQSYEPKVVGLNDCILSTSGMLRRLIGENIELVTLPAPELSLVMVDPSQIEQVLVNLAVNARDAMPDGGKLTIMTADVFLGPDSMQFVDLPPGRYVRLSVSDTGVGMSSEVQARVFEPFFTTKEVGKGTGLGLATCYGIVKQSGGDIRVMSEPGKGSTFEVFLPALSEDAVDAGAVSHPGDLPRGTETVLLVEDEPLVRSMASQVLREQGYTVLESTNGVEALRVVEERGEERIHLLLTDMVMPQMGGSELAERLRTQHPETGVLFTSGYTDAAVVHQDLLQSGTDFIHKPFTPAALAQKIRSVLTSSGSTQGALPDSVGLARSRPSQYRIRLLGGSLLLC